MAKKKRRKSQKGGNYEREVCKTLSLWWTGDKRDDIFWRSQTSGARATRRSKLNKETAGQYGDVAATDPMGAPLLDLFTIEVKRGYVKDTLQDALDRTINAGQQKWEGWLQQVVESKEFAGSLSWWLITKRDRRHALVYMPMHEWATLVKKGCLDHDVVQKPIVVFDAHYRFKDKLLWGNYSLRPFTETVIGMRLDCLLAVLNPRMVEALSRSEGFR